MVKKEFPEVVSLIVQSDKRYKHGAYYFLRQALDHTVKEIKKKKPNLKSNHISGQDLLEGIKKFALKQFGPMTLTLFNEWGIQECEDFGNIVFNLVEFRVLGKTEKDKPEDFCKLYDFNEAFKNPFLPKRKIK